MNKRTICPGASPPIKQAARASTHEELIDAVDHHRGVPAQSLIAWATRSFATSRPSHATVKRAGRFPTPPPQAPEYRPHHARRQ